VYAKFVKKDKARMIKPKLADTPCGFRRDRNTIEQISTLQQIFDKSWEPAKDVYTCFVNFKKVYGRVLR